MPRRGLASSPGRSRFGPVQTLKSIAALGQQLRSQGTLFLTAGRGRPHGLLLKSIFPANHSRSAFVPTPCGQRHCHRPVAMWPLPALPSWPLPSLPLTTVVEVTVSAGHVEVSWRGNMVARHARCYRVQQEVLLLDHYLGVLERKPGALAHSKALVQYRESGLWPESFDRFWQKLNERHGVSRGTREMIGLLQLAAVHGVPSLRQAVESALASGSSDSGTVRLLLSPANHAEHRSLPLAGTGAGFERPMPTLDVYDQLLSQAEVRQ